MMNEQEAFGWMCDSLRRNCSETTKLDCDFQQLDYPPGYGQQLGDALQGNHQVRDISIELSSFYKTTDKQAAAASFLQFLRQSPLLRRFQLEYGTWQDAGELKVKRLGREMIKAIFHNKQTHDIVLAIHGNIAVGDEFVALMRDKQSLTELELQVWATDSRTILPYVKAFRANQSLERLYLEDCSRTKAVELILNELAPHTRLLELKLGCQHQTNLIVHGRGLSFLLCMTPRLTHLNLCNVHCDEAFMKTLTVSLTHNRTVTKLTFSGFWCMDWSVVSVFCAYMRSYNPTSALRALETGHCDKLTTRSNQGVPLAYMLTLPPNQSSSVGSMLQSLRVRDNAKVKFLLADIAAHASRIRLSSLQLDTPGACAWDALAAGLSSWTSLRYLRLDSIIPWESDIDSNEVLRTVKENGNLYGVTANRLNPRSWLHHRTKRFFTQSAKRRIKAYGDRNRLLPGLLQSKPGPEDPLSALIYPYLLEAAHDIAVTGHNLFFMGLLSLGKVIGNEWDQKRQSSANTPSS